MPLSVPLCLSCVSYRRRRCCYCLTFRVELLRSVRNLWTHQDPLCHLPGSGSCIRWLRRGLVMVDVVFREILVHSECLSMNNCDWQSLVKWKYRQPNRWDARGARRINDCFWGRRKGHHVNFPDERSDLRPKYLHFGHFTDHHKQNTVHGFIHLPCTHGWAIKSRRKLFVFCIRDFSKRGRNRPPEKRLGILGAFLLYQKLF